MTKLCSEASAYKRAYKLKISSEFDMLNTVEKNQL